MPDYIAIKKILPWTLVNFSNSYRTWKRVYCGETVVFEEEHFISRRIMECIVADHNELMRAEDLLRKTREALFRDYIPVSNSGEPYQVVFTNQPLIDQIDRYFEEKAEDA